MVRGRDERVQGIRRLEKENPAVFCFFLFIFFSPTQREEESDSNKSNIGMR